MKENLSTIVEAPLVIESIQKNRMGLDGNILPDAVGQYNSCNHEEIEGVY